MHVAHGIVDVYFLKKHSVDFCTRLVVNYSNRGCLDSKCNSLYTSIKLLCCTDYETQMIYKDKELPTNWTENAYFGKVAKFNGWSTLRVTLITWHDPDMPGLESLLNLSAKGCLISRWVVYTFLGNSELISFTASGRQYLLLRKRIKDFIG